MVTKKKSSSRSKKSSKKKIVKKSTTKKAVKKATVKKATIKKTKKKVVKRKVVKKAAKKVVKSKPKRKSVYSEFSSPNIKPYSTFDKKNKGPDYLNLVISLFLAILVALIIFLSLGPMDQMLTIGISIASFVVVLGASYLVLK